MNLSFTVEELEKYAKDVSDNGKRTIWKSVSDEMVVFVLIARYKHNNTWKEVSKKFEHLFGYKIGQDNFLKILRTNVKPRHFKAAKMKEIDI